MLEETVIINGSVLVTDSLTVGQDLVASGNVVGRQLAGELIASQYATSPSSNDGIANAVAALGSTAGTVLIDPGYAGTDAPAELYNQGQELTSRSLLYPDGASVWDEREGRNIRYTTNPESPTQVTSAHSLLTYLNKLPLATTQYSNANLSAGIFTGGPGSYQYGSETGGSNIVSNSYFAQKSISQDWTTVSHKTSIGDFGVDYRYAYSWGGSINGDDEGFTGRATYIKECDGPGSAVPLLTIVAPPGVTDGVQFLRTSVQNGVPHIGSGRYALRVADGTGLQLSFQNQLLVQSQGFTESYSTLDLQVLSLSALSIEGSSTLTDIESTDLLIPGLLVSGTNIPVGATITAIGSNSITISGVATGSGQTVLAIPPILPSQVAAVFGYANDVYTGYNNDTVESVAFTIVITGGASSSIGFQPGVASSSSSTRNERVQILTASPVINSQQQLTVLMRFGLGTVWFYQDTLNSDGTTQGFTQTMGRLAAFDSGVGYASQAIPVLCAQDTQTLIISGNSTQGQGGIADTGSNITQANESYDVDLSRWTTTGMVGEGSVTLTLDNPANYAPGIQPILFYGDCNAGSNEILNLNGMAGLAVGMNVSGLYIPTGTTIVDLGTDSVTVSQTATGSGGGLLLTFNGNLSITLVYGNGTAQTTTMAAIDPAGGTIELGAAASESGSVTVIYPVCVVTTTATVLANFAGNPTCRLVGASNSSYNSAYERAPGFDLNQTCTLLTEGTDSTTGATAELIVGLRRNLFTVFQGVEIIRVSDPSQATDSIGTYVGLEFNTIPWSVGDTVEVPMHYATHHTLHSNLLETAVPVDSSGSEGYNTDLLGPAINGNFTAMTFSNSNPNAFYQGSGGFATLPQGLSFDGTWQSIIQLGGWNAIGTPTLILLPSYNGDPNYPIQVPRLFGTSDGTFRMYEDLANKQFTIQQQSADFSTETFFSISGYGATISNTLNMSGKTIQNVGNPQNASDAVNLESLQSAISEAVAGASGTFLSSDGKTITVTNGLISAIS